MAVGLKGAGLLLAPESLLNAWVKMLLLGEALVSPEKVPCGVALVVVTGVPTPVMVCSVWTTTGTGRTVAGRSPSVTMV